MILRTPTLRLALLVLLVVAAALVGGARPASASAPFNTQAPSLDHSGSTLTGHNGGFMSYSGPVDRYEFRFVRNSDGAVRQEGSGNVYTLVAGDCGAFHAEVRAGIHSVYLNADGSVSWEAVEWSTWASSNTVDVGGSCSGGTSPSTPTKPASPSLVGAAQISGQAQEGGSLAVANGSWSGAPTSFGYQWQRCSAAGTDCTSIPGATSATYAPVAADIGSRLRVAVTAANAAGSAAATTQPTEPVRARAPLNTSLPTLAGFPWVGRPVTATSGAWTASTTITYSFAWQRCSAHMNGCTAIEGATGPTYVPVQSDLGSRLRVVVAASAGGSTAAGVTSVATIVVQAGRPSGSNLAVAADRVVAGDKLRVNAVFASRVRAGRDVAVRVRVYELRGFLVAGSAVTISSADGLLTAQRTTDAGGEAVLHLKLPRTQRKLLLTVTAAAAGESASATLRATVPR